MRGHLDVSDTCGHNAEGRDTDPSYCRGADTSTANELVASYLTNSAFRMIAVYSLIRC